MCCFVKKRMWRLRWGILMCEEWNKNSLDDKDVYYEIEKSMICKLWIFYPYKIVLFVLYDECNSMCCVRCSMITWLLSLSSKHHFHEKNEKEKELKENNHKNFITHLFSSFIALIVICQSQTECYHDSQDYYTIQISLYLFKGLWFPLSLLFDS